GTSDARGDVFPHRKTCRLLMSQSAGEGELGDAGLVGTDLLAARAVDHRDVVAVVEQPMGELEPRGTAPHDQNLPHQEPSLDRPFVGMAWRGGRRCTRLA